MLNSSTRILAAVIALLFGAISFATVAQADRKKRGYSVHAGKKVSKRNSNRKQVRRNRGQRRISNRIGRRDGYRRDRGRSYGYQRGDRRRYGNRRGYNNRYLSRRDRGYSVLAGRDFQQSRPVEIIIQDQQQSVEFEEEPLVIDELRHIPRIIKMTEHQKHLGRLRAERRGDSAAKGEAGITVLSKEPQGGVFGDWSERIEKDDFGDETIVYFQD